MLSERPQQWENLKSNSHIQEEAGVRGKEVVGPWASAEPANPKSPPSDYGPQDPTSRVGVVEGGGRVAEKQSGVQGRVGITQQGDPLQLCHRLAV